MKRIKFSMLIIRKCLILIFLTINNSFSQQYHPIPSSNVFWKIEHHDSGVFPCGVFEIYDYYLNGDTLLQGLQYKKLYRNTEALSCTQVDYPYYFIGGIRQDTLNRKVYCFLNSIGQDSLLYDFNLNVNDTLPPSLINSGTPFQIIDSIDSVLVGSQGYRRTFHFSPGNGLISDNLIEGVGSTFGLIEIFENGIGDYFRLKCFKVDTTLMLGTQQDCMFSTQISEINFPVHQLEIFPNPFNNKLTINTDGIIARIEVYSIYNLVNSKIFYNKLFANSNELSIASLDNGLYIMKIIFENYTVTKKIIKIN